MCNIEDFKHPHEPEQPPVDASGRCLVCALYIAEYGLAQEKESADAMHAVNRRLRGENDHLRSLLWRVAQGERISRHDDKGDAIAAVLIEGGFTTLDEIDAAIGYDEMGG